MNLLKYIFVIAFSIVISATITEAAKKKEDEKKDCTYCNKYEKLSDWPENERPEAFIYEEIDYPEGMFKKMEGKTSKSRKGTSGKKVSIRFVKGKSQLNKNQGNMIRDMAYFEALYNEMLDDPEAKVETLESLKKGREAMRMSLQISPKAKASEAVLKFWAVGKMMKKAKLSKKQKKKIQKK